MDKLTYAYNVCAVLEQNGAKRYCTKMYRVDKTTYPGTPVWRYIKEVGKRYSTHRQVMLNMTAAQLTAFVPTARNGFPLTKDNLERFE